MLEMRIIASGQPIPLFDLPALLGRRQAAKELGDQIDGLIAFLDDLGGDPDLEESGLEDSFMVHNDPHIPKGAGCPVADAGGSDEDGIADPGWTEWQSRGRHKIEVTGAEIVGRDDHGNLLREDDEDDDAAEDDDEDRCAAGDDHVIAGPVVDRDEWERWSQFTGARPGDDVDAEDGGDTELNGDEGDHSGDEPNA